MYARLLPYIASKMLHFYYEKCCYISYWIAAVGKGVIFVFWTSWAASDIIRIAAESIHIQTWITNPKIKLETRDCNALSGFPSLSSTNDIWKCLQYERIILCVRTLNYARFLLVLYCSIIDNLIIFVSRAYTEVVYTILLSIFILYRLSGLGDADTVLSLWILKNNNFSLFNSYLLTFPM